MENTNYNIALLIDSENVSSKYMGALYKELIVLGKVTYRRMYGDFAKKEAEGWRNIVNEYSITPVQQFTYTTGKNATDSTMIIDAMDILYSGNINAVCIFSSDSDFTGLAKRLRESNIFVIGAGEKKTPQSFVKVCDRFFVLEDLIAKEEPRKKPTAPKKKKENKGTVSKAEKAQPQETTIEEQPLTQEEVEDFAIRILESTSGARCSLEQLINKIFQAYPQFDFKAFGAKKSYEFFSKEKFTITSGENKNLFIELNS